MDELSLGLAFANDDELIRAEIAGFVRGLVTETLSPIPCRRIYVPIFAMFSTTPVVTWPANSNISEEDRRSLNPQFEGAMRSYTLTRMIAKGAKTFHRPQRRPAEDFGYQRAWQERFAVALGDRAVMRRIEQEYQIKTVLLPGLREEAGKLGFLDCLTYHARLKALPLDHYQGVAGAIFDHLPTLRTKTEIMAIMGFNPHRKGDDHDFYDAQMMVVPLAYGHAFAAQDRWIRHLLTRESTILADQGVRYLPDIAALSAYLHEIGSCTEDDDLCRIR